MIIRTTTRTIRTRRTNPARTVRTARRTALLILLTAKTATKRTTNSSGFGERAPLRAPFSLPEINELSGVQWIVSIQKIMIVI